MYTDPIADMLTRIRNAAAVRKPEVVIPFSKLKMQIAQILAREGFVEKTEKIEEKHGGIKIQLKYFGKEPAITSIKRVSKPGQRVYVGKSDIPKVRNGLGIAIISTPQGVVTNKEARKQNVGGEVLCEIY